MIKWIMYVYTLKDGIQFDGEANFHIIQGTVYAFKWTFEDKYDWYTKHMSHLHIITNYLSHDHKVLL